MGSVPEPPDAQQGPHHGQSRRCYGNRGTRVTQVAVAASVGEAGDRRKHLGEAGDVAVRVPDALTDRPPPWTQTHSSDWTNEHKHTTMMGQKNTNAQLIGQMNINTQL